MRSQQVLRIEEKDFEKEVLRSDKPVFVDFYADWCGPCRMVAPIIEELAETYNGKVKFVKVNVDFAPELANKYGVMSIPTLIIFKHGKVTDAFVGAATKSEYVKIIERALSKGA